MISTNSSVTAASPILPTGSDSFVQPRRSAFWIVLLLVSLGLFTVLQQLSIGFRVVPITVASALLVWAAYAALFVLVFRTLDLLEQLAPAGYVLAFAWGGFAAVYFAPPANIAIQSLCAKLVSPEFAAVWGPAVAGPITEEFLKSQACCSSS